MRPGFPGLKEKEDVPQKRGGGWGLLPSFLACPSLTRALSCPWYRHFWVVIVRLRAEEGRRQFGDCDRMSSTSRMSCRIVYGTQ